MLIVKKGYVGLHLSAYRKKDPLARNTMASQKYSRLPEQIFNLY